MTDPVVRNLLAVYAGLVLTNTGLTAVLWRSNRTRLFGALFFVWASTLVSFALQGALQTTPLITVLGFSPTFAVNLSLAHLLGYAVGIEVRWRPFALALAVGLVLAVASASLGAPFWAVALPVAVPVALPTTVVASKAFAGRWRRMSVAGKAFAASSILFALHNLDYAFLRDEPAFAPIGFTIAILIIFALSITGPAVVLEIVAADKARIATELDAARRIQSMILPRRLDHPGLEVVGYMRPADSVGGDYFDVHRSGDDCWILLGDVTGHGLGAGLVMLMAQSTMSAIVEARPDVTPKELNHLANRVLRSNLTRLEERRHMTVVTIRSRGSHDDIIVWRARDKTAEVRPVAHFPCGLGFVDLEPADVGEEALRLEDGDLLFVGTDGVVEASPGGDPRRGVFGEDAVID
ncbi:MAG TPA: SpoIIE family protein phosphatase, partial [Gaiellaceae bacterium]|nr:SpoIIE family protein phosphatase [Gaiellaceae bacterium]